MLAASLELLAYCWNVASLFIAITLVDVYLNSLNWFNFLILEGDVLIILVDCMVFLSPFLYVLKISIVNCFLHRTAIIWNSLHIECFLLSCDLNGFKSRINWHLLDTVDWSKKWFVDFNAEKTQLVSFDRSNNNGSIDVKIDGSVLEENSSFKILGLTFFSKLNWASYVISIAKTLPRKLEL